MMFQSALKIVVRPFLGWKRESSSKLQITVAALLLAAALLTAMSIEEVVGWPGDTTRLLPEAWGMENIFLLLLGVAISVSAWRGRGGQPALLFGAALIAITIFRTF